MSAVLDRPLLRGYPDARRAPFPILEPLVFPYIAVVLGSAVAAAVGCVNAIALRRYGLAARTLLLGACGWVGFLIIIVAMRRAGITNVSILLLTGRIWHIVIGSVQYFIHRPYARGHEYLHGPLIPMLPAYLAAYILSRLVPWKVTLWLLGVPVGG